MRHLRFRSDSGIKFSLHTKFVTCVVILECILMASIMLAVEGRMRASLLKEFIQRGQFAARNLAAMNTNYLTTYNYVNIEQGTGKIVRQNQMNYAAVLMFNGDLAGFGGENSKRSSYLDASTLQWAMDTDVEQFRYRTVENEPICDFVVPVKLNERTWGKCCVGLTMKDLNAAIFQTRMVLFTLGFLALGVGCVAAVIAARRITRPVDALVTGVEAIAQGDYSRKIDITTQDEIGYLSRRFASMQDSLKDHVELLTDTNQRLTDTNTRLNNLFEASRSMNSLQNQDKLFGLILEAALTATGACQGSLFLLNGGSEPSVVATVGDTLECACEGQARTVIFGSGDLPWKTDVTIDSRFSRELSFAKILDEAHPDREMLYIPLKQSGILMGYVHLVRGRVNIDSDPSEIQALSVLASQATASLENRKLYIQLEDAYLSSVKSLAKTLEYKDEYTHGHAERVADLCVKMGERMSLEKGPMKILFNAALLHDIGKIGVMESILNKTAKLTDDEWQSIKRHPEIGEEILKPLSSFECERKLIRHHHEREDGRGYPDGIYGNELNMLEKIIIVADSFDAMNSKRAYRSPLPAEVIKGELTKNKGTQFNTEVIDIFMEIYEEELTFQRKNGGALILPFHPVEGRKAASALSR